MPMLIRSLVIPSGRTVHTSEGVNVSFVFFVFFFFQSSVIKQACIEMN